MRIRISAGKGEGPTELSAFDQALVNAGVANYNLLYLSSVLPAGSEIVEPHEAEHLGGEWGDRLYVVMAQQRSHTFNQEAWAGIGWMQDPNDGKGLLVEHEGHSEEEIRRDITASLQALAQNRNMGFGQIHMKVVGMRCEDKPVCSLVVAVFESNPWHSK